MERVLHIPGCEVMDRTNGINSFLMNVYRNIDRTRYQFDFLVYGNGVGDYDEEIYALGGNIFRVQRPGGNLYKNVKYTYEVMKKGKYKIIHRHTAVSLCWTDLLAAKRAGIKNRIVHSHGTRCNKPFLHKLFYPLFCRYGTHRLACGAEAGKWLYRGKAFKTIRNGIDVEKYGFCEEKRKSFRKKLKIKDTTFVIGNIGRISEEKNPFLLIDIFEELLKKKRDAVCIFVGDGNLKKDAEHKVKEKGLEKRVFFTGCSEDVQGWLSCMDVVVYPSLYEGFPFSVIESEAAGVPSVLSDRVPVEVDVTGLSRQVSLTAPLQQWAEAEILQGTGYHELLRRTDFADKVRGAGYDIRQTAKAMEEYYTSIL